MKKIILFLFFCNICFGQDNLNKKIDSMFNIKIKETENNLKRHVIETKQIIKSFLDSKKYDKALKRSLFGLKVRPNDSDFMLLAGYSYYGMEDYGNALKWYKKGAIYGNYGVEFKNFITNLEEKVKLNRKKRLNTNEKVLGLKYSENIECTKCLKNLDFGGKQIFLPVLKGFNECFEDKKISNLVKKMSPQNNIFMAYYNDSNICNQPQNAKESITVYSNNQYKNLKISQNDFNTYCDVFEKRYRKIDISTDINLFSQKLGISYDKPILMKKTNVGNNGVLFAILSYVDLGGNFNPKNLSLMFLSILRIKEKLIFISHNFNESYDGNRLDEFIKKNEYIVYQFLEIN